MIEKTQTILRGILQRVCFILLLAIVINVIAAVFARYVLFYPLNFADQLTKYLLIWLAFLGSSLAMDEGAHVAVDILSKKLSSTFLKVVSVLVSVVIGLFLILLVYYGFIFVLKSSVFSDPLVFGLSMSYPYLSVPVGALIMLFQLSLITAARFKAQPSKFD